MAEVDLSASLQESSKGIVSTVIAGVTQRAKIMMLTSHIMLDFLLEQIALERATRDSRDRHRMYSNMLCM
jgi:hypothetical protein